MNWVRAAGRDELADESAKRVLVGDAAVALVHSGGKYYAVDDCCTHEEASLSEGYVECGQIECPRHGALFDLSSGAVLSLPATRPLKTWAVKLDGDDIMVGKTDE
jgi:3-phenylpropionate/trans-cinnamate dioxygenase ferredoxin component